MILVFSLSLSEQIMIPYFIYKNELNTLWKSFLQLHQKLKIIFFNKQMLHQYFSLTSRAAPSTIWSWKGCVRVYILMCET